MNNDTLIEIIKYRRAKKAKEIAETIAGIIAFFVKWFTIAYIFKIVF